MSVSFSLSNLPNALWTWLRSKPAVIRYLLIGLLLVVLIVLLVLLWGLLVELPLWLFKRMIAVETSVTFVCERADSGPRGIWYHALQLLHEYREQLPINGVVVVVAAERLLDPVDKLRTFALNIRRVVDEAMHHLEVDVPMNLVFTGLERLPGFAAFAKHLPGAAKDHAVGERIDWDKPGEAWSRWERASEIFG